MNSLSTLSIAAVWRPGETSTDGTFRTERHFWDFIVDDVSLRARWPDRDIVGVLGWGITDHERESVAKLQGDGQPDYPPNRVAIFVCPECGDLGCGAVTVSVSREGSIITWSNFRWEVNWYADHPDESTEHFELGPFRFASDAYIEVLNRALAQRPKAG